MSGIRVTGPEVARSRLRATVAAVEREIERLPAQDPALSAAFADLEEQLALGPEPEVRTCPTCGEVAMRAALRCSNCWVALPPRAPAL